MSRTFIAAFGLAALLLGGCAGTNKPTGFLTSYDGFRPGPDGGLDQIWSSAEIRSEGDFRRIVGHYNKLLIDKIWVSMNNQEAYDGVNPAELQSLTSQFRQELIEALEKRYEIVLSPGSNVLRLSIGLTGVESPSAVLAATSTFLPVGIGISTVSRLVTGEHTNVGSASIEFVAADSITGKAHFAAIDRRAGGKDLKKIIDPLSDAREAFKFWANRLRATLDRAHKK